MTPTDSSLQTWGGRFRETCSFLATSSLFVVGTIQLNAQAVPLVVCSGGGGTWHNLEEGGGGALPRGNGASEEWNLSLAGLLSPTLPSTTKEGCCAKSWPVCIQPVPQSELGEAAFSGKCYLSNISAKVYLATVRPATSSWVRLQSGGHHSEGGSGGPSGNGSRQRQSRLNLFISLR